MNDPVMGGKSTSRVAVENGVLNFTGTCAIVPSLNAPGFITAVAGHSGLFSHDTFVDVSHCTGLTIEAKDFTTGYQGYRISFGTAKAPGGKFFARAWPRLSIPRLWRPEARHSPRFDSLRPRRGLQGGCASPARLHLRARLTHRGGDLT
jgi:hypothetical protein